MALLDRSTKRSANISKEEFTAFWSECLNADGVEATDALLAKTEAISSKLAAAAVQKAEEAATATVGETAVAPAEVSEESASVEASEKAAPIDEVAAQAQATALLEFKDSVADGSFDVSGWNAAKPLSEWGCGVTVNGDSGLVERLDLGSAAGSYDLSVLAPLLTPSLRFLKLLNLDVTAGDLGLLASNAQVLREVWLTGKGLVGDVKSLEACPSLARVKLRSTGVTGDVCDFACHKRLVLLWLEDSGVTGDAGALKAELPKCDVAIGAIEEE
jgi:hypothetical protein